MTLRILAAWGLGTGCLLLAADLPTQDAPKQAQVSKTEHIDFPSGGTLHFKNSTGVLTVEAWDQPGVEITTIKSAKTAHQLDRVKVVAERHGNELVITTTFPWHRPFGLIYPLSGRTGFDLEYHIKVPAKTRIIAEHTYGNVNIDNLVGDIEVNLAQGEILLHLPEDEKYSVHAKSSLGTVNSDFPGDVKRRPWPFGHRVESENSAASHKLELKVGNGDIVIVKTRIPKPPEPLTPVGDGL